MPLKTCGHDSAGGRNQLDAPAPQATHDVPQGIQPTTSANVMQPLAAPQDDVTAFNNYARADMLLL
jgi:hypothetical protein